MNRKNLAKLFPPAYKKNEGQRQESFAVQLKTFNLKDA